VREAQRTYQKRKDTATETEKRRVDELLQLLSDLSSDVETLLQAASTAGNMDRDDDVSKNIQRLWSTYDTVISNEHVQPELRLLQVKNSKRKAAQQARVDAVPVPQEQGGSQDVATSAPAFDVSDMNFDLVRFEETTVLSTFQRTNATDQYMAGRNIFEVVKERQAAMQEAEQRQAEG
jgi:SpoVK/Ycf46/Vps4 family AAA+-type ATPase